MGSVAFDCIFNAPWASIQFANTMRYLAALLTGLLGFLCLTLSAQTDCDGADHTILAGNFYYNPASLTIAEGETVAWVNEGGTHDVNGEVSVISGQSFNNPETFSLPVISGNMVGVCMGVHTFTIPGEYNYDCSIGQHAANGMEGTIVVEAASIECNDPLACNYDTAATGIDGCVFFDTNLFTLEEDMLIGLTDFEDCPTGYPGAYTIAADLTQEGAGLPLFFTITPEVESFLIEQGFEIAAQDIMTVAVSVCDTVMNYNSLVLGDEDLTWDGLGFTIDFYGSFIAPESSFEVGCPDPDACNFDACAHPEFADGCTYLDFSAIETASGDTGMVTMTELDSLTFTVTAGADVTLEWSTDCGDLIVDGNTATLMATGTGDCEVCVEAEGPGECEGEGESCIVVSVLGGLNEASNTAWELMPNPAATDLRVVWAGPTSIFEVFDLNGRLVRTATLQTGTQTIHVSELHPGLYLAGPQGTAPKRLAIQR